MILDETNTLANAIYIYLIILFTGILVGSILALLKEFMSSDTPVPEDLEKACESSAEVERFEISITSVGNNELVRTPNIHKLRPERSTKSYLDRLRSKKSETSNTGNTPQNTDRNNDTTDDPVPGLELHNLGLNNKERIRYTMQELIIMQAQTTHVPESTGKVKLSTLLRMHMPMPAHVLLSDAVLKKTLHEIQAQINEPCIASGSIAFFRLVSMSSFKEPFSNICHFREEFCDLMTYLIDSLTIYSSTITQPLLQLSLVDLAACFAWEHWNSKWCTMVPPAAKPADVRPGSCNRDYSDAVPEVSHSNITDFINDSYERNYTGLATSILQDTERTLILPDAAIFRLLCNLYLGSPAINKSVRAQSIYKLSAIFHACASRTQCGQHRELIALLNQAVASAQRDSLKAFFYELFIDLLRPHIFCCIEYEDLSASESPIYELIFKGLWTDQAPQVREKASKAVLLLGERFSDVKSWTKYMKQTNAEPGLGHVGAPGSWSEYNCE